MTPKTATLLFVNKDPTSTALSRSDADERSKIFSHVQTRRRLRGKRKQQQPREQNTSDGTQKDEGQPDPVDTAAKKIPLTPERDDSAVVRLLTSYPANNGYDPFHCTVAAADPGSHALLHYTFAYPAKTTFLAETFAPPSVISSRAAIRHYNVMSERIRRCVDDPALMYSTLAYGSSCLAWATGYEDEERTPEYFIGEALRAVRAQLSKPDRKVDTWIILCVYSLAITESWNALPEMWTRCLNRYHSIMKADKAAAAAASKTHLRAVFNLAQEAGGWTKIHPYLLESVILADKYAALAAMRAPVLDPEIFDPGPTLEWVQEDLWIGYDKYPFMGLTLMQDPMSDSLRDVVEGVVDYVRIAHICWLRRDVTPKAESWLFFRLQALIYRLQLLHSLEPRENCIRFAVLVFLLDNTDYHGSKVGARAVLPFLHTVLSTAALSHEEFKDPLMFWCLCTGTMTLPSAERQEEFRDPLLFWCLCTGALTLPSKEQQWFKDMVTRTLPYLLPEPTEKALEKMLETYLFLPDRQRSRLRGIINGSA